MIKNKELTEEEEKKCSNFVKELMKVQKSQLPYRMPVFTSAVAVLIGEFLTHVDLDNRLIIMDDIVDKSLEATIIIENHIKSCLGKIED